MNKVLCIIGCFAFLAAGAFAGPKCDALYAFLAQNKSRLEEAAKAETSNPNVKDSQKILTGDMETIQRKLFTLDLVCGKWLASLQKQLAYVESNK